LLRLIAAEDALRIFIADGIAENVLQRFFAVVAAEDALRIFIADGTLE